MNGMGEYHFHFALECCDSYCLLMHQNENPCSCLCVIFMKHCSANQSSPSSKIVQMTLSGEESSNVDCSRNVAKFEVCTIMACAHSGPM